jgi:uncharacterized repeat protein (TIGR01451 family)
MEFALILPLLLLFLLGVIEVGRMLAIYSSVSSAARQAARYGSVSGDAGNGAPFYLDCAGMRLKAQQTSLLQPLADADISIRYDHGLITQTMGSCSVLATSPTLSETIQDGDRVVISITTTYSPLVPIVPLPAMPMNFQAAHTIFTTIVGPTPTPLPNADLSISKVGFPDHILATDSSNLTYTIRVTHTGPIQASNVVMSDTLPSGMDPNSVILPDPPSNPAAGWTCTRVGLVVTCTLPFLGSGNVAPPIVLRVTAPRTPGLLTNTAYVSNGLSDPHPGDNVATASTFIDSWVDLELHKSSLVNPVAAGSLITYELTVKNNNWVKASQLRVTDTLPASITWVSTTSAGGAWGCAGSTTVVCTLGADLFPGNTAPTITIVVRAPNPGGIPACSCVINSASASSEVGDPFPTNNTNITNTTSILTDADLVMSKSGPSVANGGTTVTYNLHVTNNGPSVATSVIVSDTLPATIASGPAGAGWSCSTLGNAISCSYTPVLAVGATTPDIVVSITSPVADVVLVNTASVSSSQADPAPGNNSASVTTTINSCHPELADPTRSSVLASLSDVPADNASTSRILVTLRDACGVVIVSPPYDTQQVTLTSSRGGADTISLAPGYNNPTSTGEVAFDVRSGTAGTSTYSATAQNTVTSASAAVASTAQVNFYGCIGLGVRPVGGGQKYIQFTVDNTTGITRKLTGVSLTWPLPNGGQIKNLSLQGTTLWSAPPNINYSPFVIPGGGLNWIAGTDAARTLANGVTNQTLQVDFNFSAPGSGAYNLTTTWTDDTGGRVCTVSFAVSP